jgi:tetratricopeptide (TPR) repeat protein
MLLFRFMVKNVALNKFHISFLFILPLLNIGLVHAAIPPEEIAKRWSPSILFIVVQNDGGGGVGSGFFVDDKHAVTSWHVVSGAKSIRVLTKERNEANAKTVASLPDYDLALIEVDQDLGTGVAMVLRDEPARDLEKVYVCGNPEATSFVWSDGSVGNSLQKTEMGELIQITAPISPGSSGGPVLDSDGKVIGIIKCYLKSGQNLNFAVPVKYLQSLFSEKDKGNKYRAIISSPEWTKFKSASQDGDRNLAQKTITYVIEKTGEDVFWRTELGVVLFQNKMYEMAVEEFKKAVKIDPAYARAWANLGAAQLQLNKTEMALESYEKALQSASDEEQIILQAARAFERCDKEELSETLLKEAIEKHPEWSSCKKEYKKLISK